MNCTYHAEVPNVAFCIRCGHALCNECVRNVRGSVYCEQCIADAVEGKIPASATPPPQSPSPVRNETVAWAHPAAAFLLGLIPGVGAIYNGEFVKAAIHVLIFGTLISFNTAATIGHPLLGLMIAAFYFYMPFEAYYTAKKRMMKMQGIELETPFDQIHQQFGEVEHRDLWGGVLLIVIGALFLLGNLNVFEMAEVARFWPAVLVVLGVWLLKKHHEKAE
jgi:TM2 domain-containing membrane protein YozV